MVTLDTGIGSKWALALDGRGYLLSTLDEQSPFEFRAYTLEPIPLKVPRIDLSSEPGEQSLGSLWPRAQHSWHEGAGQEIFDSEFSSRYKFLESLKADPLKEKGVLHFTPEYDVITDDTNSIIMVGNYLIGFDTPNTFRKYATKGAAAEGSVTQGAYPGTHILASDGEKVYAPSSGGIYSIDTTVNWLSPPTPAKVNDLITGDALGFVKGRLMLGIDNDLHEITDLTSLTSGATAIWSHQFTGWKFTVFAETGPGIFAGGHVGDFSELLFISFDASDVAAGVTLGVPKTAWQAPVGESILSLSSYSGAAMLMGTSRGLRNVIVGTDGDVQVSPLIVKTPDDCVKVKAGSEFGYFTYGNEDGQGKVGIVDLGDLSWAIISNHTSTSYIAKDLTIWDDELVWLLGGLGGPGNIRYPDTSGSLATSMEVNSGEIRFGTSEEKYLRKMDVLLDGKNRGLHILDGDDIFLSSIIDPSVKLSGAQDERVVEVKVSIANLGTSPSNAHAITHGDPYGYSMPAAEYLLKDSFWFFSLTSTVSSSKPTFHWKETASLFRSATSTVDLSTLISHGDIIWLKAILRGDVGGVWEVEFYYYIGDTDEPGSYTQLGTTVQGGDVSEIYDPDNSEYPYFMGGYSSSHASYGDFIYKVRVWEKADQTNKVLDWSSNFPYVDSDGNTYSIEPRLYDNPTDKWNTYEVDPLDPNFYPLTNIRVGSGIYAEVFIQVDGREWQSLGYFYGKTEKDLGVEFLGTRFNVKIEVFNGLAAPYSTYSRALLEWRLRSEPVPKPRYLRHYVPIMLYDRMTTVDGHHIHREGFAKSELALLKDKYRNGSLLDFQPPDFSDSIKVRIDELHFKEFAPPKGASGFGGIALLVLREQE